ncbi:MAG: extracellular solute-binding protein [Thermoflexaceae bacterium]|nr:extracellular solute-binding protein [Thermoflexaceae bacterium]
MKLRRGLVLVMTAVLIMGAAGCQKQTKGDDTALGEGPMNAVASQSENGSLENGRETVSQEESMGTEGINEIVLNFWYTDAGMTEYFTDAVSRYQKENPGVVINLRMVASTGYLENINTQSIRQTNAVDVYMLHNEDLEQAYLAGLACAYEPEGTVYTTENFGRSAIRAVTYDNKQIAYPLYFNSSFLIYNKAYVTDVPATFDDILNFSNNLEYEEEGSITDNIEKTFIWPVSDYTFNYAFLSDGFVVGGLNGDDRSQINVSNDTVAASLEYYQSLYDYFAIDRHEVDYEYCLQSFIDGKNAFTFAKTGDIPRLNESGVDYGTACMPDISNTISASSLSYTQTLVVNPYSTHVSEAQKFVQALTYEYVNEFYGKTGFYPSCKAWNYDEIAAGVYANYADSTPMPKMMTLGDYYIQLEILLHTVWDDNGEINELLDNFQNFITIQIN